MWNQPQSRGPELSWDWHVGMILTYPARVHVEPASEPGTRALMGLACRYDLFLSYRAVEQASEPETRALMGLERRYDHYLSSQGVESASEPEARALMGLEYRKDHNIESGGHPQSQRQKLSWD